MGQPYQTVIELSLFGLGFFSFSGVVESGQ